MGTPIGDPLEKSGLSTIVVTTVNTVGVGTTTQRTESIAIIEPNAAPRSSAA